jgi:hypothetical protein
MTSDRPSGQDNTPSHSDQSTKAANQTALLQMAEELGRIVGKFLVEELRARSQEVRNTCPTPNKEDNGFG